MLEQLKRSTLRCCALVSLAFGSAAVSATVVTEWTPPAAMSLMAIDAAKSAPKRSDAASSASDSSASAARVSGISPARTPEALLGGYVSSPASSRDQMPHLDEKSAPWAQNDPYAAPSADGSVWINGEPEVTWFRSALNYLRDEGLTAVIVVLTLVGLAWLIYAIWSYLQLSLTRADEVRPRRKRHRHSQGRGSERSDGQSSTREHRRRRHSRPSS